VKSSASFCIVVSVESSSEYQYVIDCPLSDVALGLAVEDGLPEHPASSSAAVAKAAAVAKTLCGFMLSLL